MIRRDCLPARHTAPRIPVQNSLPQDPHPTAVSPRRPPPSAALQPSLLPVQKRLLPEFPAPQRPEDPSGHPEKRPPPLLHYRNLRFLKHLPLQSLFLPEHPHRFLQANPHRFLPNRQVQDHRVQKCPLPVPEGHLLPQLHSPLRLYLPLHQISCLQDQPPHLRYQTLLSLVQIRPDRRQLLRHQTLDPLPQRKQFLPPAAILPDRLLPQKVLPTPPLRSHPAPVRLRLPPQQKQAPGDFRRSKKQ